VPGRKGIRSAKENVENNKNADWSKTIATYDIA